MIKKELKIIINKTSKAIDKAYYDGKINIEDYNEIPEEYKNKIMELPDETIEIIGLEIFDMKEVTD